MKRRALLTSMGVGMAGMAGCLGGNSNNKSTPKNKQGSPIAVSTPKGKKAQFKLTTINASATAEVGSEYQFEVSVKNTGDQPGVYRVPVKTRTGDDVRYREISEAMIYLEPGTEKTAQITVPAFNTVGNSDVRFAEPENTWQVNVVGPKLPFGESFRVDGLRITYETLEFRDSVTYKLGGIGDQTYTPRSDGNKFAVVIVKVRGVGRSSWMGDAYRYKAKIDGNKKSPFTDAGYNKRSLSGGETKRVELPYEVPGDATKADLVFRYSGQRQDRYADWSTRWGTKTSSEDDTSTDSGSSDSSSTTTTSQTTSAG